MNVNIDIKCDTVSRLDKYLTDALQYKYGPGITRTKVQQYIRDEYVRINGNIITDCGYKLQTGVYITCQYIKNNIIIEQKIMPDIDIIYEDDHIIVINKPDGIVVHHGAGTEGLITLLDMAENHVGSKLYMPHRLDQHTSGLIVFAKNTEMHLSLSRQFENRLVRKVYYALCWNIPVNLSGTIDHNIDRMGQKMIISPLGKSTITKYQVIEQYGNAAACKCLCYPLTGRTHQIRLQMAYIGCTIIGDKIYGKQKRHHKELLDNISRHALHAYRLSIFHDVLNKTVNFKASVHQSMLDIEEYLLNLDGKK